MNTDPKTLKAIEILEKRDKEFRLHFPIGLPFQNTVHFSPYCFLLQNLENGTMTADEVLLEVLARD